MTTPAAERVTVGLVRGFHGLRGAVRLEVLSDEPERFAVGSVLFAEGDERPLTVAWSGPAKPGLLLRFEELPTRESVEYLRERYLEAEPGAPLPEGTYYWHQIRGLAVTTTTGEDLGTVVDVFRAGEGEVYVARGGRLGEVMVPAVKAMRLRTLLRSSSSTPVSPCMATQRSRSVSFIVSRFPWIDIWNSLCRVEQNLDPARDGST